MSKLKSHHHIKPFRCAQCGEEIHWNTFTSGDTPNESNYACHKGHEASWEPMTNKADASDAADAAWEKNR